MDLFPIKAEPSGPPAWIWFVGLCLVVMNFALWFAFAIVIAKAVQIGWHL